MFETYEVHNLNTCEEGLKMGLYATTVGYLKAYPNYMCRPRVLEEYYMVYIEKGKGILRCQGKTDPLTKGSLFFLFPGIAHAYQTDSKDLIHQRWIGFKGICAHELIERLQISPERCCIQVPCETTIVKLFEKMYVVSETNSLGTHLNCTAVLYEIFAELLKGVHSQESVADDEKKGGNHVQRALSFIENNYYKAIDIEAIAKYAGLSRAYLARKFKEEVGCSPTEQLAKIRLYQAMYYLQYSDDTIEHIANRVGIEDTHYFSRFFKKHMGVSPSAFRKISIIKRASDGGITKASF